MRICCLVLTFFAVLMLTCGCAEAHEDYTALFRGGFEAELDGTVNGVAFRAVLCASPAGEQGQELHLSFLAPQSLAALSLHSGEDGMIFATAGELSVPLADAGDLPALLTLFPITKEASEVSLDDEGHTVVKGADSTLLFHRDGTPLAASRGPVTAKVVRFAVADGKAA